MLLVLSMWVKTLFGMFGGGAVAVVDSLSFLVAAMVMASLFSDRYGARSLRATR